MASNTTIEWTEKTWIPVIGCEIVSSGCALCYAAEIAADIANKAYRRLRRGESITEVQAAYMKAVEFDHDKGTYIGSWTGEVIPVESRLNDPLRWRRPSLVFLSSMSDVFHPDIPDEFILRMFDVMEECERHTFQVLTKRPERAAEMASRLPRPPNVWMGTSIENASFTNRVAALRRTRAKIKFLSVEPLLGPIPRLPVAGIDWVIVGGESGPGARPMQADWVRQIRDRCVDRGVAFFFKQWGKLANNPDPDDPTAKENGGSAKGGRMVSGQTWDQMPEVERLLHA